GPRPPGPGRTCGPGTETPSGGQARRSPGSRRCAGCRRSRAPGCPGPRRARPRMTGRSPRGLPSLASGGCPTGDAGSLLVGGALVGGLALAVALAGNRLGLGDLLVGLV